jgi:diacylglycerol kinase
MERLIKAFQNSVRAFRKLARTEAAFQQELGLLILSFPLAWLITSSWRGYAVLIGAVLFLIVVEVLNTGIEAACDAVSREFNIARRADFHRSGCGHMDFRRGRAFRRAGYLGPPFDLVAVDVGSRRGDVLGSGPFHREAGDALLPEDSCAGGGTQGRRGGAVDASWQGAGQSRSRRSS